MSHYEELETPEETPEELSEAQELEAAEKGEGYDAKVGYKAYVTYTGPWPESEAQREYARKLSDSSELLVMYSYYVELHSDKPFDQLTEETLTEMVQSNLEDNDFAVLKETEPYWIEHASYEIVDSRSGEVIDGFGGSYGMAASKTWPSGTDNPLAMGVGGDLYFGIKRGLEESGKDLEDSIVKANLDAMCAVIAEAGTAKFLSGGTRSSFSITEVDVLEDTL